MVHDLFPIPTSGTAKIIPRSHDTFDIEFTGLNAADREKLFHFFMKMQGRFGTFRFEYTDSAYTECRFDTDTGPAIGDIGPGPYNLTLPIKILPP
jgi:hypothetical protein